MNPNAVHALATHPVVEETLAQVRSQPGITMREIAWRQNVTRQAIAYHLQRLVSANLVTIQTNGRHKTLWPVTPDVAEAAASAAMVVTA